MPLVSGALIHFDESSIVGDPVTAWTNNGSGGSSYDLDVVGGTAANLTQTTVNSLAAVNSDGTAYIETTSGTTITGKMTEFMVFRLNVTGGNDYLSDARSNGSARHARFETGGDWGLFGGSTLDTGIATDTDLHVGTAQWNQDSTTKYTISGVGDDTGNAGNHDFDFGTLFARYSGASRVNATICEYVLYDSELSGGDIATNQAFLEAKWGLSTAVTGTVAVTLGGVTCVGVGTVSDAAPILTAPTSLVDGIEEIATGADLVSLTSFNAISSGGFSLAQPTTGTPTGAAFPFTYNSGYDDAAYGVPSAGVPFTPDIESPGITNYTIELQAINTEGSNTIAVNVGPPANFTVIQTMAAEANTGSDSVFSSTTVAVENNHQALLPTLVDGSVLTWLHDGTLLSIEPPKPVTFDYGLLSPTSHNWSVVSLTISSSVSGAIIQSLDGVTCVGVGTVSSLVSGSLAQTLSGITCVGVGLVSNSATPNLSISVTGLIIPILSVSGTIDDTPVLAAGLID